MKFYRFQDILSCCIQVSRVIIPASERARGKKDNGFWIIEGILSSLSFFPIPIWKISALESMCYLLEPIVAIDANVIIPRGYIFDFNCSKEIIFYWLKR